MKKYAIYSHHKDIPKEKVEMRYACVDPGETDMSLRFERRISKNIDCKWCNSILTIHQERRAIDFSFTNVDKVSTACAFVRECIKMLEDNAKHLDKVDIFIIEEQMSINTTMIKIQTAITTYIVSRYPNIVMIAINSRQKTLMLDAPPKLSRHFRKKWGNERAMILATARKDKKFKDYIEEQLKTTGARIHDDSDVLLMIEAFCVIVGYGTTYIPEE